MRPCVSKIADEGGLGVGGVSRNPPIPASLRIAAGHLIRSPDPAVPPFPRSWTSVGAPAPTEVQDRGNVDIWARDFVRFRTVWGGVRNGDRCGGADRGQKGGFGRRHAESGSWITPRGRLPFSQALVDITLILN